MFSQVLQLLVAAWNGVYSWTNTLFNKMQAWDYVIAAIVAMLVIRFTVYPSMKMSIARSSDSVTSKAVFKIEDKIDERKKIPIGFR